MAVLYHLLLSDFCCDAMSFAVVRLFALLLIFFSQFLLKYRNLIKNDVTPNHCHIPFYIIYFILNIASLLHSLIRLLQRICLKQMVLNFAQLRLSAFSAMTARQFSVIYSEKWIV
jgi:hypothetical protein